MNNEYNSLIAASVWKKYFRLDVRNDFIRGYSSFRLIFEHPNPDKRHVIKQIAWKERELSEDISPDVTDEIIESAAEDIAEDVWEDLALAAEVKKSVWNRIKLVFRAF